MKNKNILFISICLVVWIVLLILFCNSDFYYSMELSNSIKENDMVRLEEILQERPSCVNQRPSLWSPIVDAFLGRRALHPLTLACRYDNIDIVKKLLEYGADPNCNDGSTPLSVTYNTKEENWYEISCYLLDIGADINYKTSSSGEYSSILSDIVQYNPQIEDDDDEVIESFVYALDKCDHSVVDWDRVFYDTVYSERIEIVKILLEGQYCDVNTPSYEMKPLMTAVKDEQLEMVILLLNNGADTSAVYNGKTAYDYAIETGNQEIIDLLS